MLWIPDRVRDDVKKKMPKNGGWFYFQINPPYPGQAPTKPENIG
jgi:hypothetical protein